MNRLHRSAIKMGTVCALATMLCVASLSVANTSVVAAATAPELSLNVLLVGTGSTDPTTAAWSSALTDEGVAFTQATATGTYGAETVTLPALTTGSVGNFDAVVIADSPAGFASGQLTSLFSYESTYQVRQIDGYTYPIPAIGETAVADASTTLDNTNGHPDRGRSGRPARPEGQRALRHRDLRGSGLGGDRCHRGRLHPLDRQCLEPGAGRCLPAPDHRPPGRGVRAGPQLRLQRHRPPVAVAGPRPHQLGDQRHPPRPRPATTSARTSTTTSSPTTSGVRSTSARRRPPSPTTPPVRRPSKERQQDPPPVCPPTYR